VEDGTMEFKSAPAARHIEAGTVPAAEAQAGALGRG
jgi:hypothetical protein